MRALMTMMTAGLLVLASGCSVLGEPVAEKVADAIDKYCEEPFNQRQVYRESINAELLGEGHSIAVTCSGDPSATSMGEPR